MRLFGVLHQCAVEGVGMRARQDGQRGKPLLEAVGKRPGDAAAPVVAGKMEAFAAVARRCDDRHRIIHQAVDVIARGIARIGARRCRVAALARGECAITHVGESDHLRAPAMHRFRKAMQQQHQRRTVISGGEHVEGQLRRDGDFLQGRHTTNLAHDPEKSFPIDFAVAGRGEGHVSPAPVDALETAVLRKICGRNGRVIALYST